MKNVGKVKVLTVEPVKMGDSNMFRCVALSDEQQPTVIYRPESENPQAGFEYNQILTYDSKLKAVIRYQPIHK